MKGPGADHRIKGIVFKPESVGVTHLERMPEPFVCVRPAVRDPVLIESLERVGSVSAILVFIIPAIIVVIPNVY